jgi:hypothetical protein
VTLAESILQAMSTGAGRVAVEPPGAGDGYWAGAPSALWSDGSFWLAYRLRSPLDQGRGYANVVASSSDGERFQTVGLVTSAQFGAASLERPALIRRPDGGWRLYVSCSRLHSKAWWVEAVDAASPASFPDGVRQVVLADDAGSAWKDVVVHPAADDWRMWACRHPLDGGDAEADRMSSWFATSPDGLDWTMSGPALTPTKGGWDGRGTRIASVLEADGVWAAFYDGRASAEENWNERTGVALGSTPRSFAASAGPTRVGATARYLSIVTQPDGYRVYWEASRSDGAHELRTAWLAG